jgi:long-chain-fatty-acid--[acyl-carrier-protein] ligase
VKGLSGIEKKGYEGVLFLPNHPALIDPIIISTLTFDKFRARPVADHHQVNRKGFKKLIGITKPITIPDPKVAGLKGRRVILDALETSVEQLKNRKNMLVYPAGKMTFTGYEEIGGNCGVEYIVKRVPNLRIVLVRTKGLWGSVFSRAYGYAPDVISFIPTLIKAIVLNFIFFIPKRAITIEFFEPSDFPKNKSRVEINRYLERFYDSAFCPNTVYPYFFLQGKEALVKPEPCYSDEEKNYDNISESIKETVLNKIRELAIVDKEDLKGDYLISKDLGIDSLSMVLFLHWIEKEFGFDTNYDLNEIKTVNDCFLAASGKLKFIK